MQRKMNQTHTPQQHSDMDTIDDMEMDDAMDDVDASAQFFNPQSRDANQGGFGTPNRQVPNLNLSMLPSHQGFKGSQPGTPVASARPLSLQNNPTVSSVNTPTLMPNPLQNSQFRGTPDSSTPGTPAELDDSMIGPFGELSMQNAMLQGQQQFARFTGNNDMVDLCIDEPAKRLFSPTGGINQSNAHFKLSGAQYGPNSDIARRIREQQMLAGVPDTTSILPNEEPKPYRCPVIGCEKAYKNQNGLKYHKAVSNIGRTLPAPCFVANNSFSMATTANSCTTMRMARFRLSIQRHPLHTPEHLAWRKKSHTDVRFVGSVTRTSTGSNTTNRTPLHVTPIFNLLPHAVSTMAVALCKDKTSMLPGQAYLALVKKVSYRLGLLLTSFRFYEFLRPYCATYDLMTGLVVWS